MSIEIRLATAADAAAVADIYAPSVAAASTSFELEPPDAGQMQQRIVETLATYPWLVCEEDGRVIGYAYAGQHRTRAAYQWSVDSAVYIRDGCRGRGVGHGLYTSLFRILCEQGFYNAYAGITLPNAASVALHEAVGFRPVGVYRKVGFKHGAWHDVGWWHLALQAPAPDPQPPRPITALCEHADLGGMLAAGAPMIAAGRPSPASGGAA